jgi:hypothetical protein
VSIQPTSTVPFGVTATPLTPARGPLPAVSLAGGSRVARRDGFSRRRRLDGDRRVQRLRRDHGARGTEDGARHRRRWRGGERRARRRAGRAAPGGGTGVASRAATNTPASAT